MSQQYAKGRHAIAECQRGGHKMMYRDLVEDGHIEGLLVCRDCWEPRHPQEIPPDMTDPVALYRPAPEISVPLGYGDAENLDGGTTPTTPSGAATGVLAETVNAGDTQIVINTAVTYLIGQWLLVALDGGGYFVSRITAEANSPAFAVPFTSAFVVTATAGNDFHIEAG